VSGLERRLQRLLEDTHHSEPEDEREREMQRERIRQGAEHANHCRSGEEFGRRPLYRIDEGGDVFCTHDGKSVTDYRQILAEHFYWMEVEWGGPRTCPRRGGGGGIAIG
jgi:hypothetical protein